MARPWTQNPLAPRDKYLSVGAAPGVRTSHWHLTSPEWGTWEGGRRRVCLPRKAGKGVNGFWSSACSTLHFHDGLGNDPALKAETRWSGWPTTVIQTHSQRRPLAKTEVMNILQEPPMNPGEGKRSFYLISWPLQVPCLTTITYKTHFKKSSLELRWLSG
jgi:hypothetical protein